MLPPYGPTTPPIVKKYQITVIYHRIAIRIHPGDFCQLQIVVWVRMTDSSIIGGAVPVYCKIYKSDKLVCARFSSSKLAQDAQCSIIVTKKV